MQRVTKWETPGHRQPWSHGRGAPGPLAGRVPFPFRINKIRTNPGAKNARHHPVNPTKTGLRESIVNRPETGRKPGSNCLPGCKSFVLLALRLVLHSQQARARRIPRRDARFIREFLEIDTPRLCLSLYMDMSMSRFRRSYACTTSAVPQYFAPMANLSTAFRRGLTALFQHFSAPHRTLSAPRFVPVLTKFGWYSDFS